MHANASRHSALSHRHAEKIEVQLQLEVAELSARAEAADAEPLPEGLHLPEELARREARLRAIGEAKAEIEVRAAERFAGEQADYEAKGKAREEQEERTGKKPRGAPPAPPTPGPRAEDQINKSTSPIPTRASCPRRVGLRAKLQRPSGGGYRDDAGGRHGDARYLAGGERALGRRRLLQ